jgi:hypothetical protein
LDSWSDIGVRRRSHPLKRVVQVEVSFPVAQLHEGEGERHHYPTLPDAAFHEVARDSVAHQVLRRPKTTEDPFRRGERIGPYPL